jgi:L-lactate utilization protein LutB
VLAITESEKQEELTNYGQWTLNANKDRLKSHWNKIPTEKTIQNTVRNISKRGVTVTLVNNKQDALKKVKELIPSDSTVMNGSSTTLYQIGFMNYYIKQNNHWKILGPEIFNEKDPQKKKMLQRKSLTADYFIASVNAIAETGQLVATDRSGSRISAFPFAAKNLILVAGVQKITKNLNSAMKRIQKYVLPLEKIRAKKAYGISSEIGKWVIIEKEVQEQRIHLILVKESLGF